MLNELIEKARRVVGDTVSNVKNAGRRQSDIVRAAVKPANPIGKTLGRRFSAISRTGERVLGTTPHGSFERIGDRSK